MNKSLSVVFSFLIVLVCIFAVINIQAFDANAYVKGFEKFAYFDETLIKPEDSEKVAANICEYLSGRKDDMQIYVKEGTENVEVFSAKELSHMEDVRNLFITAQFIFLMLVLVSFLCYKKLENGKKLSLKYFNLTLLAIVTTVAIFAYSATLDFITPFIFMHKILFSNSNWILTPGKDTIISLMPTEFFTYFLQRIIVQFQIILSILCLTINVYIFKLYKKKDSKII